MKTHKKLKAHHTHHLSFKLSGSSSFHSQLFNPCPEAQGRWCWELWLVHISSVSLLAPHSFPQLQCVFPLHGLQSFRKSMVHHRIFMDRGSLIKYLPALVCPSMAAAGTSATVYFSKDYRWMEPASPWCSTQAAVESALVPGAAPPPSFSDCGGRTAVLYLFSLLSLCLCSLLFLEYISAEVLPFWLLDSAMPGCRAIGVSWMWQCPELDSHKLFHRGTLLQPSPLLLTP